MLFDLQQIAIIVELCVYFINQMINDFPRVKANKHIFYEFFLCIYASRDFNYAAQNIQVEWLNYH